MWLMFLDCFNGSVYSPESEWLDSDQLQLFTDSAGVPSWAVLLFWVLAGRLFGWPAVWSDFLRDITFLELVPIVLAFYLWGSVLQNRKLCCVRIIKL